MKVTPLSPVYIVQRMKGSSIASLGEYYVGMEYYDLLADSGKEWGTRPYFFDRINDAARVAAAEGAEIRVLVSTKEAKELGFEI